MEKRKQNMKSCTAEIMKILDDAELKIKNNTFKEDEIWDFLSQMRYQKSLMEKELNEFIKLAGCEKLF